MLQLSNVGIAYSGTGKGDDLWIKGIAGQCQQVACRLCRAYFLLTGFFFLNGTWPEKNFWGSLLQKVNILLHFSISSLNFLG